MADLTKKISTSLTQLDTSSEGNNDSSEDVFRSRKYVFTINNFTLTQQTRTIQWLRKNSEKFIIAEEVGEKGTPHLQGFMQFKNPRYRKAIKKDWGFECYMSKAKGSIEQNLRYCSKDGKYETNCHLHDIIDERRYLEATLKPWQEKIYKKIMNSMGNDRKIIWIWESKGNIGKSFLIKYILYKHRDIATLTGGKTKDIAHQMVTFKADKGWSPRIVFGNMTRDEFSHINYNAMEKLKDGAFPSGKYESSLYLAAPSLIVICANAPPDTEKVTSDRWDIIDLNEKKEEIDIYENYLI